MVKLRRLYGQIAVSRSDPLQGSDKNRAGRQAGNNISAVRTVWRGIRICTVIHGEHWGVEAFELILYELRPKWKNKEQVFLGKTIAISENCLRHPSPLFFLLEVLDPHPNSLHFSLRCSLNSCKATNTLITVSLCLCPHLCKQARLISGGFQGNC